MDIHTGNTKEIMANSYMEITTPGFNKMVLGKIIKRQKKRLIISYILFYLLIVGITAGIIVTSARGNGLIFYADIITNAINQLGTWFLTNEFIIFPFLILLIIKWIIDMVLRWRINN